MVCGTDLDSYIIYKGHSSELKRPISKTRLKIAFIEVHPELPGNSELEKKWEISDMILAYLLYICIADQQISLYYVLVPICQLQYVVFLYWVYPYMMSLTPPCLYNGHGLFTLNATGCITNAYWETTVMKTQQHDSNGQSNLIAMLLYQRCYERMSFIDHIQDEKIISFSPLFFSISRKLSWSNILNKCIIIHY